MYGTSYDEHFHWDAFLLPQNLNKDKTRNRAVLKHPLIDE